MYWLRIYEEVERTTDHSTAATLMDIAFKKMGYDFFNLNMVNRYYNEIVWR